MKLTLLITLSSLLAQTQANEMPESLVAAQFTPDPYLHSDKLQMILNRQLQLVGCSPSHLNYLSKSSPPPKDEEDEITCYYCDLGQDIWKEQKVNPSLYSSFRDMIGQSIHCDSHVYPFPLQKTAQQARQYDSEHNLTVASVKGVVHNQPSSGSSVLMNAIIVGEGDKARVYSDHPAVIDLVNLCSDGVVRDEDCDIEKQVDALKDLVYLLSRTEPKEESIYLKMIPSSTANMSVLKSALTNQNNTKWIYVWRDANEMLTKVTSKKRHSCLKKRNNPSEGLLNFVKGFGYDDLQSLTDEEVCSAYYAYNHEMALYQLPLHDPNTVILNYESSIKNHANLMSVLANHFSIPIDDNNDKVTSQLKKKSHSRSSGRNVDSWVEEEDEPNFNLEKVREAVVNANKKFFIN